MLSKIFSMMMKTNKSRRFGHIFQQRRYNLKTGDRDYGKQTKVHSAVMWGEVYSRDSSPNSEGRRSDSRAMMRRRDTLVEGSLLPIIQGIELTLQVYDVRELHLTKRTLNRLRRAHINTLQDLARCTESDILYIPCVGVTTLKEIKGKLNAHLSMILSRSD